MGQSNFPFSEYFNSVYIHSNPNKPYLGDLFLNVTISEISEEDLASKLWGENYSHKISQTDYR